MCMRALRASRRDPMKLDSLDSVLADVRLGRPVVVVDDGDRENEGDLIIAAERVSDEVVNFMIQHGKGLLCLSLTGERLAELAIREQVIENVTTFGTKFTVSIDHRSVEGFGVTARGRAETIRRAIDRDSVANDFVVPGFVFPLRAIDGGVLKRRGHTEASVDLARLAGLKPAGVICEVMGENGEMIRGEALEEYCRVHQLKITSVEEIINYRLRFDTTLRRMAQAMIPDLSGLKLEGIAPGALPTLRVFVYVDDVDDKEHLAFVCGEPKDNCLVRIHSECLTGDVFGSKRCDCGDQWFRSLARIVSEGAGVLIYLHQEGRGIGLANKLRAYELQDRGLDTVEANVKLGFAPDYRNYRAAAQMLNDLGLRQVQLMTSNPEKIQGLADFGIEVSRRVSIPVECHELNAGYLRTKRDRLGHAVVGLN